MTNLTMQTVGRVIVGELEAKLATVKRDINTAYDDEAKAWEIAHAARIGVIEEMISETKTKFGLDEVEFTKQ